MMQKDLSAIERINQLDVGVFEAVPSQTSKRDKRALLAVQRTVAGMYGEYVYLEIGSHLGGSIQPHLLDDRCKRIYSIDARPQQQPDDRAPGYIAYYENNSTERMLRNLEMIGSGDIGKIECFDADASEVDRHSIKQRPRILFIDGEHTKKAVISDFRFCREVMDKEGVILFDDFKIIWPAIREICDNLRLSGTRFTALKFKGGIFGIFFNPELVSSDPFLARSRRASPIFWVWIRLKKYFQ